MGSTVNECFLEVVERRGDGVAFLVKRDGAWRSFSYDWALEQVRRTAFGLRSLGYERGTRFALLSENRPEWATTDYAAMAAGFVLVPLYTSLIPSQVAYILNDAEARVVFVSSMDHLETIRSIRDQVPSLEKVVVFYPEDLDEDGFVISLDTLKKLGEDHSIAEFTEMSLEAEPEDTATFVYTSGTTGDPKGVVLSHGNFMAQHDAIGPVIRGCGDGSILISFLPLSHILQRAVDSLALLRGFTVAYAESLETLGENLREVRPTVIVAVPRVWEKIFSKINEGVQRGSAVKRSLFNWAVGVGRRFREAEYRGRVPFALSLQHALADALVFRKIRVATGGRMELFISTGAPLAKELAVFFHAVGITIIEAWGMTELSGGATINTLDDFLFGSVGKPGPGVELKVTDDGEICVRGGVVMQEYWRKPEVTTETIDSEGWLHSGDVGHVDDEEFVYITDRIKELIVTAGGKNVAPQPIENSLKADRFISQAMVIGDRRRYCGALIVPDKEVLEPWATNVGIEGDLRALCGDPRVRAHYEAIVGAIMEGFSRYERVKRFELVPDEFSQELDELTPTLKLKRRVLLTRYADLIDAIYS